MKRDWRSAVRVGMGVTVILANPIVEPIVRGRVVLRVLWRMGWRRSKSGGISSVCELRCRRSSKVRSRSRATIDKMTSCVGDLSLEGMINSFRIRRIILASVGCAQDWMMRARTPRMIEGRRNGSSSTVDRQWLVPSSLPDFKQLSGLLTL